MNTALSMEKNSSQENQRMESNYKPANGVCTVRKDRGDFLHCIDFFGWGIGWYISGVDLFLVHKFGMEKESDV